ncbi:Myblike DNAbinding domain-containing protein, partial [Coemansia sp. 'formosensis']
MLLLLARCRLGAPSALARSPVRWRCAYRLRTVELHDGGGGGGSYPVVIKGTNLWTVNQARALIDGVSESRSEFNTVDWQKVADGFPDRTPRACKSKYRLLMRDMALAAGAGHTLRLAKGAYELVAREKEAWTPDDDETLLALHEVWATKWDRIAKSIGKYTPAQCQGRYYWIRKKKRKQAATGDDQSPAKNRTGEQQAKKELPRVRDPKHWSEAEDRKLRDLLIKHGRLDRHAASELLPGFSLAHIYYELDKALSGGPHLAEGMWTAAEHRALLALVERHGRDWRAISHAMPTNRSATQCRLRYACCSSGPVTKHRWTADEEERLRLL